MFQTPLTELLNTLRKAGEDPAGVSSALQEATDRLKNDADHAQRILDDVRSTLSQTRSTHALTEAGILSDEPLLAGTFRRLGAWLAPPPPRQDALEGRLAQALSRRDRGWLSVLQLDDVKAWIEALLEHVEERWDERSELGSALVILATRAAGAGLDARLSERMPELEVWTSPFVELSRQIDVFAEHYVRYTEEDKLAPLREAALASVDRCLEQVELFRADKEVLGTTLHLSSGSLRMLQQLERLRTFIEMSSSSTRANALARLSIELMQEHVRRWPTLHFVREKMELISFLVVGHAAQKGSKYAVRSASDYRGFWIKSILGGFIVAIFASFKLHLSHEGLAPVPQALIYGLNYALCFVFIYIFGATLATKQPALTASRLAESLEGKSESFPELVRAIWRSQFVSFLGNIAGAAVFAALFAVLFSAILGQDLISESEAIKLHGKLHPWNSGSLFYAAIAGVMLSAAGFIAGFIDNLVVFHRVSDRVVAGRGIFRLLPRGWRAGMSKRMVKSTGAVSGNVVLGFMLGSAGAFGAILGLPLDIRHIAFASSHSTLAVMHASELVSLSGIGWMVLAVSMIGLVNFLVSFSLTLAVALSARRLVGVNWRQQLGLAWKLARSEPGSFFLPPNPLAPAPKSGT